MPAREQHVTYIRDPHSNAKQQSRIRQPSVRNQVHDLCFRPMLSMAQKSEPGPKSADDYRGNGDNAYHRIQPSLQTRDKSNQDETNQAAHLRDCQYLNLG